METREFPNTFPEFDGDLLIPEDAANRKVGLSGVCSRVLAASVTLCIRVYCS